MSIFSSISSRIKSLASSVGSGISSIFGGGTSQSANALDYNNPYNAALQASNKGKPAYGTPAYYATNPYISDSIGANSPGSIQMGGSFTPPQGSYSTQTGGGYPISPTSYSSGTKISSSGSSNYSSPSYSTTYANSGVQSKVAPTSTVTNASNIGAGTTTAISPSSPGSNNYHGAVTGANISVGADPVTGMFPPQVDAGGATGAKGQTGGTEQPKTAQQNFDDYLKNIKAPPSEADAYNRAQNEGGLLQAQQQRNNTQNEINGITSKMNTDLLNLRGTAGKEGVTEAVYGGQQAEVTREASIRLLPLQAQLAADQNNLQLAQDHTDTLFKIYADDAKNSVTSYNDNLKLAWDFFTTSEKKKAEETLWQKNFNADLVKKEMDNQSDIAKELLKTGNTSAYKAITSVRPPTNVNSPTYAQDFENYKKDLASTVAKYGISTGVPGENTPLYRGLNPATATAVRQQVSTFKTEPSVQNFVTIQEGRNFAGSLDNKTKNPVDDQGLIYSLAKALDPGSVVREGEYATAQKYAQSWISAYGKGVTQAISGTGFLTEKARKNIKDTIEARYKSSLKTYDNLLGQYKEGINNLTGRTDGDKFLRDYKTEDTASPAKSNIITAPDGSQIEIID